MTPKQFTARRLALGYETATALGAALGKDRVTIWRYESGRCDIPKTVALAMASLPPADKPGKES